MFLNLGVEQLHEDLLLTDILHCVVNFPVNFN